MVEIYDNKNYDVELESLDGIHRVSGYDITFSEWSE